MCRRCLLACACGHAVSDPAAIVFNPPPPPPTLHSLHPPHFSPPLFFLPVRRLLPPLRTSVSWRVGALMSERSLPRPLLSLATMWRLMGEGFGVWGVLCAETGCVRDVRVHSMYEWV